jgi:hypothetical protein
MISGQKLSVAELKATVLDRIDIPALGVGDFIEREEIEAWMGHTIDESIYAQVMRTVISELQHILRKRGVRCILKQEDYGIKIMSHSEANSYSTDKALKGYRQAFHWRRENAAQIDPTALSSQEAANRLQNLRYFASLEAAIARESDSFIEKSPAARDLHLNVPIDLD